MPDEKGHSRQCPALRHEALWFLFFRPGGFGFFFFFTGERGDVQSKSIVVLTIGKVFLPEGSLVFLWQFQGVFSAQCSSEKACSFLSI